MRTESLTDPVSRRSFETALEVAGENEEAVAVHAWVYREGRWVPHAWCEIDGFAVDLTRSTQASAKADYYLRMGIMPLRCRTYTRLEFFEQMADQGHLGPFDQTSSLLRNRIRTLSKNYSELPIIPRGSNEKKPVLEDLVPTHSG